MIGTRSRVSRDCIGAAKCAFADQCLPGKARRRPPRPTWWSPTTTCSPSRPPRRSRSSSAPAPSASSATSSSTRRHGLPSIVRNQGSVEVSGAHHQAGREVDRPRPRRHRHEGRQGHQGRRGHRRPGRDGTRRVDRADQARRGGAAGSRRRRPGQRHVPADRELDEERPPAAEDGRQDDRQRRHPDEDPPHPQRPRQPRGGGPAGLRARARRGPLGRGGPPHPKAADQNPYPSAKYTPVNVSALLRYNLWTVEDTAAIEAQAEQHEGDGPPPRKNLTVAALSATLPEGLRGPDGHEGAAGQVRVAVRRRLRGLGAVRAARQRRRPTSTRCAARSRASRSSTPPGTPTGRSPHPGPGRGQRRLRAGAGRHRDRGPGLRRTAEGRRPGTLERAVPVGRRRAAQAGRGLEGRHERGPHRHQVADDRRGRVGETCTLVIVDRPARARSNPVDDARVEMLMESAQMDKWAADRLVYVSGCRACCWSRRAGRLIRTTSDSGMVAVLDPRLLKTSPFAYNHATRTDYLETPAPVRAQDRRPGQGPCVAARAPGLPEGQGERVSQHVEEPRSSRTAGRGSGSTGTTSPPPSSRRSSTRRATCGTSRRWTSPGRDPRHHVRARPDLPARQARRPRLGRVTRRGAHGPVPHTCWP